MLTTTQELRLYIPSHTMDEIDPIKGFLQQAERSIILPIVGRELYKEIVERYSKMNPQEIVGDPNVALKTDEEQAWIRLIKACQMPMVFKALYDSVHIQSVSINSAGINSMTTDGYPEAKGDKLDNYRKSCYTKWHEGIEQLLILLEEDAQCELFVEQNTPLFEPLWKESKYYYLQADRLICTASVFDRFVSIGDKRERFVALTADLAYCEDVHIRPEMGEAMMKRIISQNHSGKASPLERRVYEALQRALAFEVEARNPTFKRADAKNDAEMSIRIAIEMIKQNAMEFMPEYASCAFYQEVVSEPTPVAKFENGDSKFIFVPPFLI